MKSIGEMTSKEFLLTLVKSQVMPALGCTEIGIVSLACAKAASLLPSKFAGAIVTVSPYVFRNDARVGVPRLGRCGMKVIAAAGIILKNPEKKLACLDALTPETIEEANKLGALDNEAIEVDVDYSSHPVYTKCVCVDDKKNRSEVVIQYSHDNIISAKLNDEETLDPSDIVGETGGEDFDFDAKVDEVSIQEAYQICKKLTVKECAWLEEGVDMNNKVVEEGIAHPDTNAISNAFFKLMKNAKNEYGFSKNSWTTKALAAVCYAVDARMYGCPFPVMTSSRSGDHGLTVSIPQYTYWKEVKHGKNKIEYLRALMFAHFITWKIKSNVGHLCGMCGSVVGAGAGTIAGLAFQKKWSWEKINNLLNMYMVSSAGIICDGAKPSCSWKILCALSAGFLCMAIADLGGALEHKDGIVHESCEKTLDNLAKYSRTTQDSIIVNVVDLLNAMNKIK